MISKILCLSITCFQTSFKYAPNEFAQILPGNKWYDILCVSCLLRFSLCHQHISSVHSGAAKGCWWGSVFGERTCHRKHVLVFKGGQHVYFPFFDGGGGGGVRIINLESIPGSHCLYNAPRVVFTVYLQIVSAISYLSLPWLEMNSH